MRFGLMMFVTDETIQPVELARAAEAAGFDSLFLPEHTHIPASRETPWGGGPGQLPREYSRLHDPFVALTAAAVATERLKIGTGVCLVIERDPIVLAKEVASLDMISGGRFRFGIGAGWNREEMRNHGTDPRQRFAIMRERVLAMRALWTDDEATFHGEHVDFDAVWCWPKPVQRPHPPILMGGNGPKVLDRVLEYGDEWLPNMRPLDSLAGRVAELRRRAEENGRGRIGVTYFGAHAEDDELETLAAAGVDGCLLRLTPAPAEQALEEIGRCAELAARHG